MEFRQFCIGDGDKCYDSGYRLSDKAVNLLSAVENALGGEALTSSDFEKLLNKITETVLDFRQH